MIKFCKKGPTLAKFKGWWHCKIRFLKLHMYSLEKSRKRTNEIRVKNYLILFSVDVADTT